MVVGFNHNFRYKGEIFHVQTEDGGLNRPQIITLLYKGGTILASKKTPYADITKVGNLDQVVEDLMKEQHKEMLRRLKDGEFDAVIDARSCAPPQPAAAPPIADSQSVVVAKDPSAGSPVPPSPPTTPKNPPVQPPPPQPVAGRKEPDSLDDIILAYLMGGDKP